MERKNATIHILGRQYIDGSPEETQISVVGTLSKGEKGYLIEYVDYEPYQNKTVISLNGKTLLMTKIGETVTEMFFCEGERSNSDYQTPYGSISIGIYTEFLESSVTTQGGKIILKYNIDFNSGFAAKNELEITVDIRDEQEN